MTRRGYGFLFVTILVYLAANQTRVGWLYLIDAAMVCVLAVSVAAPWLALRGLHGAVRLVDLNGRPLEPRLLRPQDGDDALLEIVLAVPDRGRALIRLTLALPAAGPGAVRLAFFLPFVSSPKHEITAKVRCAPRGPFLVAPVQAESSAPFGLARRRRAISAPVEVLVYPRWYPLSAPASAALLQAAQDVRPRLGVSEAFFGVREYRPGDPVRAIHWRSSLRRGHLVIKEFEETARPELAVALDLSHDLRSGDDSSLEDSIRLAASLIRWALDAGYPVSLLSPGAPRHPISWHRALDYLARVQLDPTSHLADTLAYGRTAPALIVLSATPNLAAADVLAARRGLPTAVVGLRGYAAGLGPRASRPPGPGYATGLEDGPFSQFLSDRGQIICRPGDDLGEVATRAVQALTAGRH